MTSTKFLEKKEYTRTIKDMNKKNKKLKIIALVKMMECSFQERRGGRSIKTYQQN